jgi:hypothetical protein
MLLLAVGGALAAALAGGASLRLLQLRHPSDNLNTQVAEVCQIIRTLSSVDQALADQLMRHAYPQTPGVSPLPWPPLPHEILRVDIFSPPFSLSSPPNHNHVAWETSLQVATTTALEPWLVLEKGNKELHNALSIATVCLYRTDLLVAYRKMVVDKLRLGRWWSRQTITLDSKERWDILGGVCGWVKEG